MQCEEIIWWAGVPWAVYRYQIEPNIRGRCVDHITGRGVLKQGWKWSEQLSAERQTMRRHVLVVTVIYSHIIIVSFILGPYQIQNMDFKYHTAINNGDYKYINHHCPIYIYHGSQWSDWVWEFHFQDTGCDWNTECRSSCETWDNRESEKNFSFGEYGVYILRPSRVHGKFDGHNWVRSIRKFHFCLANNTLYLPFFTSMNLSTNIKVNIK